MRIAVTGAGGTLGQALCFRLTDSSTFLALNREAADITSLTSLRTALAAHGPDVIINCAAATDVDRCEKEPDWAYSVNAWGAWAVATVAAELEARLIHISTDFVFPGDATTPYSEWDATDPVNVYGASKLAGERSALQANPRTLVVRTQWLYGPGGDNFALLMLRLAEKRREQGLRVVADQTGTPTYTPHLARKLLWLAEQDQGLNGVMHVNNAGSATRLEWVQQLFEAAGWGEVPLAPAASEEFPTPARRPTYSVLRRHALELMGADDMPAWQEGVVEYVERLREDPEARALLHPDR